MRRDTRGASAVQSSGVEGVEQHIEHLPPIDVVTGFVIERGYRSGQVDRQLSRPVDVEADAHDNARSDRSRLAALSANTPASLRSPTSKSFGHLSTGVTAATERHASTAARPTAWV